MKEPKSKEAEIANRVIQASLPKHESFEPFIFNDKPDKPIGWDESIAFAQESYCSLDPTIDNSVRQKREKAISAWSFQAGAEWHSTSLTTALKEREDEIKRLKELFNIVFNIDGMTTSEFCAEYLIELPTWKGDVSLAASEFIRIDAIKWKIIKDAAKEIWNTPTDLTVQNGKD